MEKITNMRDLCEFWCAESPDMLNHRIYKSTDCGASISVCIKDAAPYEEASWVHNGEPAWKYLTMDSPLHSFTIQTIVEGSDATVDSEPFVLPVDTATVDAWIQDMEAEADYLWREANEWEDDED